MTSVGIRELRQSASELLRRVAQGETIEITDRGRPVALLSPLPDASPLEQLRAGGQLIEASSDFGELAEPLALPTDVEWPSTVLGHLRHSER
jgi:prevent-host-death family protein